MLLNGCVTLPFTYGTEKLISNREMEVKKLYAHRIKWMRKMIILSQLKGTRDKLINKKANTSEPRNPANEGEMDRKFIITIEQQKNNAQEDC